MRTSSLCMGAEARRDSGGHEGPPAAVEALVLALHMVVAEAAHAHVHCVPACGPILHAHARLSVSACLANDFAPQSRQASEMMHAQVISPDAQCPSVKMAMSATNMLSGRTGLPSSWRHRGQSQQRCPACRRCWGPALSCTGHGPPRRRTRGHCRSP